MSAVRSSPHSDITEALRQQGPGKMAHWAASASELTDTPLLTGEGQQLSCEHPGPCLTASPQDLGVHSKPEDSNACDNGPRIMSTYYTPGTMLSASGHPLAPSSR